MHRGTEGLVDAGLQPAAVCFFSIYKQRTLKGAPIPPASARKLASLPGFPLRRLTPTRTKSKARHNMLRLYDKKLDSKSAG